MDVDDLFELYARRYAPLITLRQAAEIGHRRLQTMYELSSEGEFDDFKLGRGGIVLLHLRGYLRWLAGAGGD